MNKKIICIGIVGMFLLTCLSGLSVIGMEVSNSGSLGSTIIVDDEGNVERWALVVGTDPYYFCSNDANDMYDVLISNGWDNDHIQKIVGVNTTKDNFDQKIIWLEENEDSNDIVLFFFSGHGGRGYIALYDNNRETYDTNALFEKTLDSYFDNFESDQIALIFDTCNSGSLDGSSNPLTRTSIINTDSNDDYDGLFDDLAKKGRVILTSCKKNEYSWVYYDEKNGYFSYFLIEGFSGEGDDNNNGVISAEEAFYYAKDRTTQATRRDSIFRVQHPQMYDGVDGPVDIIENYHLDQEPPELFYNKIVNIRPRLISGKTINTTIFFIGKIWFLTSKHNNIHLEEEKMMVR